MLDAADPNGVDAGWGERKGVKDVGEANEEGARDAPNGVVEEEDVAGLVNPPKEGGAVGAG